MAMYFKTNKKSKDKDTLLQLKLRLKDLDLEVAVAQAAHEMWVEFHWPPGNPFISEAVRVFPLPARFKILDNSSVH